MQDGILITLTTNNNVKGVPTKINPFCSTEKKLVEKKIEEKAQNIFVLPFRLLAEW
jgi:hypothetical protein